MITIKGAECSGNIALQMRKFLFQNNILLRAYETLERSLSWVEYLALRDPC